MVKIFTFDFYFSPSLPSSINISAWLHNLPLVTLINRQGTWLQSHVIPGKPHIERTALCTWIKSQRSHKAGLESHVHYITSYRMTSSPLKTTWRGGKNSGHGKNMSYKENNGPIDAKRWTNERKMCTETIS